MNGFNKRESKVVTEQLPADSSGIINMSSPSGSSDSGSSGIAEPRGLINSTIGRSFKPFRETPGKNMANLLAKVQKESLSSVSKMVTVADFASSSAACAGRKGPTGGQPLPVDGSGRQKTDMFLTQFQAQMSQMKSAMDAVQNEILHHKASTSVPPPPVVSPLVYAPVPVAGRGRGRGAKILQGPPGTPGLPPSVIYHSQISAPNGLKLKIRKSPHSKRGAHFRGGHGFKKKRRKKGEDEDEDVSDFDDDDLGQSSRTQVGPLLDDIQYMGSLNGLSNSPPSGWGDSLPENVLFNILSIAERDEGSVPLLIRASKVCRLWHKVASNPELWRNVDLATPRIKDVFRSERNLTFLLQNKFFYAKHLNISGWSSALTNLAVDFLVDKCKFLMSLGMSGCQKLSASNLKAITETCTSLNKLDLSAISTTYNTKSAVSPLALGEAAEVLGENLEHLSLASNCLANCPQIIASLAEHCPNLQVLDLSSVTSPRRDSIFIRIEQLQLGCPLLRILRLTNSEIVLGESSLKDQASARGFPELEELSVAVDPKKCPGMDDSDLERIVKNSNKLRLLDVRGCTKISDSGLVRVPAWDLEHLYLSGCFATKSSNDGLELIVRKWRHSFKEIDFSWNSNEDAINLAVKALAEVDDDEKAGRPVEILDLCGSSVSFESVKAALKTCLHLRRLNLTSCRALPRGIKRSYQTLVDVVNLREQILGGKFDDHTDD